MENGSQGGRTLRIESDFCMIELKQGVRTHFDHKTCEMFLINGESFFTGLVNQETRLVRLNARTVTNSILVTKEKRTIDD